MKKLIFLVVLGMVLGTASVGCEKSYYSGSIETGFAHFPRNNKISPEKAVDLAQPYLAHSYELRKKNLKRHYTVPNVPFDFVVLKGDFYYIVRDDEPNKFINFYIPYAVKINKRTGEITKPDEKTDAMVQYKSF